METRSDAASDDSGVVASIEPRSFKRGNDVGLGALAADALASIEPRSFKRGNLAQTFGVSLGAQAASIEPRSFKRGNQHPPVVTGPARVASIEPRSFKRGNEHILIDTEARPELQLSHVHSNVETIRPNFPRAALVDASIEPRSFKRGNTPVSFASR